MTPENQSLPMTQDGYLSGQLLVATPQIQFSSFHRSVVFIAHHNAEGAMGLIINQPMQHITLQGVAEHFNLSLQDEAQDEPIYFGGPIDTSRGFVLHSNDYAAQGTAPLNAALSMTSSQDILKDMILGAGPEHRLVILGYSGWSAGQLDKEIEANSWITIPATQDLLFNIENNDKWMRSNSSLGIDPYRISDVAGHA